MVREKHMENEIFFQVREKSGNFEVATLIPESMLFEHGVRPHLVA